MFLILKFALEIHIKILFCVIFSFFSCASAAPLHMGAAYVITGLITTL